MANDPVNLSVTIWNATPNVQDFFIFAAKPEVSESPKVFQNAYLSQYTPPDGKTVFHFPYTLYAICGYKKLGYGTMIDESQTRLIKLGTKMNPGTVTDVILNREHKMAEFDKDAHPTAAAGTFGIKTGGDSQIGGK